MVKISFSYLIDNTSILHHHAVKVAESPTIKEDSSSYQSSKPFLFMAISM